MAIIKKDQNRVDVIFEIEEGPKTTVEKISFIGNARFGSDVLKDVMVTKENAWYRFPKSNRIIRYFKYIGYRQCRSHGCL